MLTPNARSRKQMRQIRRGGTHYLSGSRFEIKISDCAVCGCFFDVAIVVPYNDATIYCKPSPMVRKRRPHGDMIHGTNAYSFEEPFRYEMTRLPSSFTCSTAPLLLCVITLCDDIADVAEADNRDAALGAASGGAFEELANESVETRLSNERNGCCCCCCC